MMSDWGHGMGFGGGPLMILFWILVIAAIVALIVWLMRQTGPGGSGRHDGPARALEILEQRYANGEIEREEFERKRQDLMR